MQHSKHQQYNGINSTVSLKCTLISFRDPQSEKKLTGGANWMPHVAPTSWGTPGAPMVRSACTPRPSL